MSSDNKRKTLTLSVGANINMDKVFTPKKSIEKKMEDIPENKNAKDFLKSNFVLSSRQSIEERQKQLQDRQSKKSIVEKKQEPAAMVKPAAATKPTIVTKSTATTKSSAASKSTVEEPKPEIIEQVVVEKQEEKIPETQPIKKKVNSFDILRDIIKKEKEEQLRKEQEEKAKKEREEARRQQDLENRKKQEEQLRKFNAKARENKEKIEEWEERKKGNFRKKITKESDEKEEQKEFNKVKSQPQEPSEENRSSTFRKDKKEYKFSSDNEEDSEKKLKTNKGKNVHTYVMSEEDDVDSESDGENFRKRRRKSSGFYRNKEKRVVVEHQKITQDIELPEFITVSDLAEKINEKKADVVKKLISMGMPATVNQTIDADTAELLVVEFGHSVKKRVSERDIENKLTQGQEGHEFVSRAPVVTIMGHVDHGKTSLLDAIRTTKVAEGESGGITQHIGASRVEVENGKFITFIDTPGHEAFTEMRMRGANITDIVVLVVAADDGVKDQTIEAINHAKAAHVPIIVAVNKIDKPGADPSLVKQELLQYDIVTEDFGGDIMVVEVSAKQKIGLDKLRETILLQAEMLDLKAPIDVNPSGAVIEAKVDSSKGTVVSLLVQKGILKIGDIVLAGTAYGRIKKMVDDKNKTQKEASPSMAVEILGFNSVPNAGDEFFVVNEEKEARDIVAYRERKERENKIAKRSVKSLDSMLKTVGGKSAKQLPVIIKADVNGSIEAIIGTLIKLNTPEVEIDVVHSGTGAINESDVNLATISNALIIGFNVRANTNATEIAKEKGVEIRYYSIIYNIVDDIKNILSGMLEPIHKEEITGHAEIKQVFKVTGAGKVAGCFVTDGEISRNSQIRLIRDGVVIYTGKLKALRRFKEDVKEVKAGYECGMSIDNYEDIKEKDVIEGFKITEEKRSL